MSKPTLTLLEQCRKKASGVVRSHVHERTTGKRADAGKGLVVPRLIQNLLDLLGDEDLAAVANVYREAMTAMRRVWIDQGKDENGRAKGYWQEEPDHRTRIQAANMVAAYMEGLPVQRQIQLKGDFVELGSMLEGLRMSGEAKRLLPAVQSLPSAADG